MTFVCTENQGDAGPQDNWMKTTEGNTNSEEIDVSAEPVFIPLLGAYMD